MTYSPMKTDAAIHSFEAEIAAQVGINAAVVYRNIVFWVRHNEANRKNFHDGRYWTYNSLSAFDEQFPYLTAKQIRTAIDKLIEAGMVVKGNFAADRFNRANWYALGEPICPQGQIDQPPEANDAFAPEGTTSAPEGKCIKNRYKPYLKPYPPRVFSAEEEADLEKIWYAYPKVRRRNKSACLSRIADALSEGVDPSDLLAAVQTYAQQTGDYTRSKVCFSDNWFTARRWEGALGQVQGRRIHAEAEIEKNRSKLVQWIEKRQPLCRHITAQQLEDLIQLKRVTPDQVRAVGLQV